METTLIERLEAWIQVFSTSKLDLVEEGSIIIEDPIYEEKRLIIGSKNPFSILAHIILSSLEIKDIDECHVCFRIERLRELANFLEVPFKLPGGLSFIESEYIVYSKTEFNDFFGSLIYLDIRKSFAKYFNLQVWEEK